MEGRFQPVDVHQIGQRSESHLRRSFRHLGYPLLFRQYAHRISMYPAISQQRFHDSMPRFPPPGSRGPSSPASSVLSRHSDFQPSLSPRFVSFARTIPRDRATVRSQRRLREAAVGPGVGCPVSPSGFASVETTGSPKFLGNPNARLPTFFDPGRPMRSRPLRNVRVAPAKGKTKAPTTRIFRGSIAWLSG